MFYRLFAVKVSQSMLLYEKTPPVPVFTGNLAAFDGLADGE